MRIMRGGAIVLSLLFLVAATTRGGEFDRVEGDLLGRIVAGDGVTPRQSLGLRAIEGLPAALRDTRSAFLIVKTGQGNLARILAVPGLRKPPEGEGEAVPVFVLERFDTFVPGKSGSRLARGAGVILFDGFQIDLDSGQIVPRGQGGDLEFQKGDADGPALKTLGQSTLYTLTKPVALDVAATGPSPGKMVIPGDFTGRFQLSADGRWTGLLQLEAAPDHKLTGQFRSDANGTSYAISGTVSADVPNRATFTIQFPRTVQEYDAYLATEGKNALAGTFVMLGRTFGFHAIREGTRPVPIE
jgi:hypothetical protein